MGVVGVAEAQVIFTAEVMYWSFVHVTQETAMINQSITSDQYKQWKDKTADWLTMCFSFMLFAPKLTAEKQTWCKQETNWSVLLPWIKSRISLGFKIVWNIVQNSTNIVYYLYCIYNNGLVIFRHFNTELLLILSLMEHYLQRKPGMGLCYREIL